MLGGAAVAAAAATGRAATAAAAAAVAAAAAAAVGDVRRMTVGVGAVVVKEVVVVVAAVVVRSAAVSASARLWVASSADTATDWSALRSSTMANTNTEAGIEKKRYGEEEGYLADVVQISQLEEKQIRRSSPVGRSRRQEAETKRATISNVDAKKSDVEERSID